MIRVLRVCCRTKCEVTVQRIKRKYFLFLEFRGLLKTLSILFLMGKLGNSVWITKPYILSSPYTFALQVNSTLQN